MKFPPKNSRGYELASVYQRDVPLILDESVGIDEGTAFVHCAPGCGPTDYEIGVKNNLEIYSPVSPDGRYTELIEPKELQACRLPMDKDG